MRFFNGQTWINVTRSLFDSINLPLKCPACACVVNKWTRGEGKWTVDLFFEWTTAALNSQMCVCVCVCVCPSQWKLRVQVSFSVFGWIGVSVCILEGTRTHPKVSPFPLNFFARCAMCKFRGNWTSVEVIECNLNGTKSERLCHMLCALSLSLFAGWASLQLSWLELEWALYLDTPLMSKW